MLEIKWKKHGQSRKKKKKVSPLTDPTALSKYPCLHAIPHVTTSFTKSLSNSISPRVLHLPQMMTTKSTAIIHSHTLQSNNLDISISIFPFPFSTPFLARFNSISHSSETTLTLHRFIKGSFNHQFNSFFFINLFNFDDS
jgi:hypothetical protein